MIKISCPNCEFHCTLTSSWSGKCNMYRITNAEEDLLRIENRFYSENIISEITYTSIESVPIFHYKPGISVLDIGTVSCNFDCKYCLNDRFARISPDKPEGINLYNEPPEHLVRRASLTKTGAIVFGNNEPTVSLEYVLDLAKACKKTKIPFGIVTNGFMSKNTLSSLLNEGIDFINYNIKSFNPKYLNEIIGINADLAKNAKDIFLRNLKDIINSKSVQIVEVSTPVIHNLNNFEVVDIAKEIAKINPQIPYHIQRVVPAYQILNQNIQTGLIENTLEYYNKALEILDYVYFGAFPNTPYVNTICPNCDSILIRRADSGGCRADLTTNNLKTNFCPKCNTKINMVL